MYIYNIYLDVHSPKIWDADPSPCDNVWKDVSAFSVLKLKCP